jgi:hypothetical protein
MPDRRRIGFDRTILSEWLDAAAARVMRGEAPEAARKFLWDFLEDVEPGETNNSGRGKTLTVPSRIWVSVPSQAEPLRQAALRCIARASGDSRVGVHWAMVAGTHPFFFDVVTQVGKLIKLHGQANRSQIKRRMVETWGDRSTLERTIQHVLRSITRWRMLRAGTEHGSLIAAAQRMCVNDELAQLLIHSVLLAHGRGLPFSHLTSHPALFPFDLQITVRELMRNSTFRVQRQGDQSDIVELTDCVVPLINVAQKANHRQRIVRTTNGRG